MDIKKSNSETTTCITRQKDQFYVGTGNIYETVAIMAKRSDQIAAELKSSLQITIVSRKCSRIRNRSSW